MGCDGGSIPTRCELVKTKEKTEVKNVNELNRIKWFSCAISKEPLKEPIVTCAFGNLYNKEAVITALLSKNLDSVFSHIRTLKDVTEIKFTSNPAYTPDSEVSPYICPVTKLEVGGRYRFIAIPECGCVISQRALREVPSKECLNCGKRFDTKNNITLNNTEEEIERMKKEMQERRLQDKRPKKKSQKKKFSEAKKTDGRESQTTNTTLTTSTTTTTPTSSTSIASSSANSTSINASSKKSSEASSKGVTIPESRDTATTIKENNATSSKKRKSEDLPHYLDPNYVDKEVYASIFTSSLSKKPKPFEETFLCRNVARV